MPKKIKPIEPPDSIHLNAADGWLGLGDHLAANDELEKITPELIAHPAVLTVRYEIYAKVKKWDGAAEIAGTLVKLIPEQSFTWICWAYATRRKTGGSISHAKKILLEAEPKFPSEYMIRYNLACYECQLGHQEEAMLWLEKAMVLSGKKDICLMALDDPGSWAFVESDFGDLAELRRNSIKTVAAMTRIVNPATTTKEKTLSFMSR